MFRVSHFSKGDLIVDKVLNRHGLIVAHEGSIVKIKWIQKPDSMFSGGEESFQSQYVRNKIVKGDFVHQEKKDKTEEG